MRKEGAEGIDWHSKQDFEGAPYLVMLAEHLMHDYKWWPSFARRLQI